MPIAQTLLVVGCPGKGKRTPKSSDSSNPRMLKPLHFQERCVRLLMR
jgi:hypothetical protein